MTPPGWIIIGCWITFMVFWYISALWVKAVAEQQSTAASLAYRLPMMIGAVLMFGYRIHGRLTTRILPDAEWIQYGGAVVCVAGLLVCLWARVTLAGNWSSNVTFKKDHELIRRGPYRFVRHPIYTGLLLMALGLMLYVGQLRSLLGLALWVVGLWIKLKDEEKLMLQHFPDQYPDYCKQVKALVPFVI